METENIPQLDKVNEILGKYVRGLGINFELDESDISSYFNYTDVQLRALDADDSDIISGILLQKATKLQLEINKHTRTKGWAERTITDNIADSVGNMLSCGDKFTPYPMRISLATQHNEYTNKLYKIVKSAQLHIDTLQYIPKSLQGQADFFMNLAKSKRYTRQ